MKKGILSLLILILVLFLSGCWDYEEYEQMTQIYSIGIDLDTKSDKVTVTLQFIPVSQSSSGKPGGGSSKGTVYSASASTLMDAFTKLQQASPNKLFYGYTQVLIIGEDAARYIMGDLVEYFERTPGIRNSVNLIIVPGKAEGVIATRDPNSTTSSGRKMRLLLSASKSNGTVISVTFHDFLIMMARKGVEAVAPRIITTSFNNGEGNPTGGTRNDIRFAIEQDGNLIADGMAVFKKDKFIDWLDDKETLGLNWILGNKIISYKTSNIDDPRFKNKNEAQAFDEYNKRMLYYYITRSRSKIKVKIENNTPVIYVDVSVEAALRKYYSSGGNEYITSATINLAEEKLANSIYSDVKAALKKGQGKLNTDIFGFGFDLYRQHPKEWHEYYEKSWNEIFKEVPVKVNVHAKINNTGTNIKKFETK
ncbi:Ger(x)C family spore germination protein [Clostridium hydrogenum]|uniref:Ger(x)C family spore germination protein n=1 Tax=Clostridium hydrogenum TaxID=2855764 RepID=UPI001F33B1E2|nr:Ger(x)C family spore germination protein [Clostridium hydrogenum]